MKRLVCLCFLLMTSTGCQSLLHELKPHRLWRMNYMEPAGRSDGAFYSVSDPLDVAVEETEPELEPTSAGR